MARIVENANQITAAAWAGDFFDRDHMIPGGARVDAAQWASIEYTITATEIAAIAAVAITVAALPVAVPSGTPLSFDGVAAVTSADAAAGATTLAVEPLEVAVADNATAVYTAVDPTPVTIISGTIVGRTLAERDAGTAYGPAAAADDEVYIVCFDVYDAAINPDVELYRPNSIVKETFLPGWAGVAAAVKTLVRAAYVCTVGAP